MAPEVSYQEGFASSGLIDFIPEVQLVSARSNFFFSNMKLEGSGTDGHIAAVHAQNVTELGKTAHKCLFCALGEGELWQDGFLIRIVSS